jgi:ATP-dependent helicase/DNAse subunit B
MQVGMKGIIDRIEKKDDMIRIVDYKTGQDDKNFADVAALFDRDNKKRNKAIFQTFFYALLYLNTTSQTIDTRIQSGLFNIRDIFRSDFSPLIQRNKTDVQDIKIYLDEFEDSLKALMAEVFDPNIPFDQTEDSSKCEYCPYTGICNR